MLSRSAVSTNPYTDGIRYIAFQNKLDGLIIFRRGFLKPKKPRFKAFRRILQLVECVSDCDFIDAYLKTGAKADHLGCYLPRPLPASVSVVEYCAFVSLSSWRTDPIHGKDYSRTGWVGSSPTRWVRIVLGIVKPILYCK